MCTEVKNQIPKEDKRSNKKFKHTKKKNTKKTNKIKNEKVNLLLVNFGLIDLQGNPKDIKYEYWNKKINIWVNCKLEKVKGRISTLKYSTGIQPNHKEKI